MKASDDPSRYCKGCRYPLTGLIEHRCPECGREFDPDDPETWSTGRTPRWVRLIFRIFFHPLMLLVLGWGVHLLMMKYVRTLPRPDYSIGWYVSGAMVLVGLVLLFRKRWTAIGLIVLNPAFVYVAVAATGYCTGSGVYLKQNDLNEFFGMFSRSMVFIDSESRLRLCPIGEPTLPDDWFQIQCNNVVLSKLGEWFGPARGAYSGPFPSEEEAYQAMSLGETLGIDDIRYNILTISGETIAMEPNTLIYAFPRDTDQFPNTEYWNHLPQWIEESEEPIAVVLEDKCLLLCVHAYITQRSLGFIIDPMNEPVIEDYATLQSIFTIYIIDIDKGIPIAWYHYSEHPYPEVDT